MKYLKLFESKIPTYKVYEIEDKSVHIISYLGDVKIGEIAVNFIKNGYWMFEDVIKREGYDKLFPNDRIAEIEGLVIHEGFKKKGYGRLLMNRLIKYLKSKQEYTIYLNASPLGINGLNLYRLVNFYKSFGFKTIIKDDNNEEMILNIK